MASPRSGRWDDPWQKFAPSKPIAAEGGISSSKARGTMADTWWSKRFVHVLESYGLGGRMTRGRTYARKGQVLSLDVTAGLLVAQVQGSRHVPYAVTVRLATPSATQWSKIDDALRSRVGYAARLLAGEVPTDLEAVFVDAGCAMFPSQWRDLRATCSCPDWGDPCKHQAAVLYVFADQLDADPWRLLSWLGRSRDEIVGLFAGSSAAGSDDVANEVAPWWPLRPGGPAATGESTGQVTAVPSPALLATLADEPGAVLARVGAMDATAFGQPINDVLLRAYLSLSGVDPTATEPQVPPKPAPKPRAVKR
jgi:uncharacterized Zn finger protein